MTDLELAREWLRELSDDPEDAVALAAIITHARLEEAKWWWSAHPEARARRIAELEQAAGGGK